MKKGILLVMSLIFFAGLGIVWAQDAKKEHDQMKKEHQKAHDEHDEWLKTIGKWRVEHRKALAALRDIESHILDHEAVLEELAEHAREHDDHMHHHDEEIAEHEKTGDAKAHADLVKSHQEMLAQHARMKKLLAEFHDDHDALMAELKKLRDRLAHPKK